MFDGMKLKWDVTGLTMQHEAPDIAHIMVLKGEV